jgi:hypothetical protein
MFSLSRGFERIQAIKAVLVEDYDFGLELLNIVFIFISTGICIISILKFDGSDYFGQY